MAYVKKKTRNKDIKIIVKGFLMAFEKLWLRAFTCGFVVQLHKSPPLCQITKGIFGKTNVNTFHAFSLIAQGSFMISN